MTQYYHTPIPLLAAADALTFRSPFGELDAAIYRCLGSGTSYPASPTEGDQFWRTDSNKLYVYDGAGWQEVSTGGATAGVVDVEGTAGEALSERDVVYLDTAAAKWKRVDIDATPPALSAYRGVVVESGGITNNAVGTIRIAGLVSGFTGLTAGLNMYATTSAGGYTQTRPTVVAAGVQKAIVQIGVASSTTEALIVPGRVEYLMRDNLANNATLTIQHHSDALGRLRIVDAYVSTQDTGLTLATYASSNQDISTPLRGPSGAGATESSGAQTTGDTIVGDSGGVDYYEGQSFTCTAGRLTQITFTLSANSGSPSGDITWEIQTNAAGLPSNTILLSGTITPTPSAVNTINIIDGVFLAASTTYWLVLHAPAQATNVAYNWTAKAAGTYANGQRAYASFPGTSWTADARDQTFSITTSAVSVGDKLSQSFQCTAGTCDIVTLWLKKVGTPTGALTLRIETDSAGSPSGTLVDANATVNVLESTLSTSYSAISFDFATNFALAASTTYHLVLSTDRASSAANYVLWGSDQSSPSFATGEMKAYASSTWSALTRDACFTVMGVGLFYEEKCCVGRWSGGTRDIATRFDDAASPAADGDTKTTFKNVIGATADVTCIVRLP